MTMPTLIQKNQDKELISRAKKVYSDINNALLMAQQDYGDVGNNGILFNETDSSLIVAQNLIKYFNGAALCKSASEKNCDKYFYDIKYATLQLDNSGAATVARDAEPKIIFPNGAVLRISSNFNGCKPTRYVSLVKDEHGVVLKNEDGTNKTITYYSAICANLYYDVNGPKPPNQFGHDTFWVWVYKNKVSPASAFVGGKSLTNILSGKDKLEYVKYTKGQTFEF